MLQVSKITNSSKFVQNKIFYIKNLTNMKQVANITNSSRLEKQVLKDAQFWLGSIMCFTVIGSSFHRLVQGSLYFEGKFPENFSMGIRIGNQ